jgi:molybdopterin converting factor small subunit
MPCSAASKARLTARLELQRLRGAVLKVTVAGVATELADGSDGFGLFTDKTIVALRVNGELRDLAHKLADGDEVEGVAISSPDGLNILRHSAAHVLAQAVQNINPEAKLGIGPPITDGFYYDFQKIFVRLKSKCKKSFSQVRGSFVELPMTVTLAWNFQMSLTNSN